MMYLVVSIDTGWCMKVDGNHDLRENFKVHELAAPKCDVVVVSSDALNRLQRMRDLIGKPINVNSAFRNPEFNDSLENSIYHSCHQFGNAYDIWVEGMTASQLWSYARIVGFRFCYEISDKTLHVDMQYKGDGIYGRK